MSAERDIEVRANLDENAATVTETREVSELFDDNGELRPWEDTAGWDGRGPPAEDDLDAAYEAGRRLTNGGNAWVRQERACAVLAQRVTDYNKNTVYGGLLRPFQAAGPSDFRPPHGAETRRCTSMNETLLSRYLGDSESESFGK